MQLNRLEWINGIAERGALNSLGKWLGFDFDGRILCLSVFNYGHSVGPWEIEDAFTCQRVACRQGTPFDPGRNVMNDDEDIQFTSFWTILLRLKLQQSKFRVQQAQCWALHTPGSDLLLCNNLNSGLRFSRARARAYCVTRTKMHFHSTNRMIVTCVKALDMTNNASTQRSSDWIESKAARARAHTRTQNCCRILIGCHISSSIERSVISWRTAHRTQHTFRWLLWPESLMACAWRWETKCFI